MSAKLSDKLNVPIDWSKINWTKGLIISSSFLAILFLTGIVFRLKALIVIAELAAIFLIITSLVIFFISAVRNWSAKNDPKS